MVRPSDISPHHSSPQKTSEGVEKKAKISPSEEANLPSTKSHRKAILSTQLESLSVKDSFASSAITPSFSGSLRPSPSPSQSFSVSPGNQNQRQSFHISKEEREVRKVVPPLVGAIFRRVLARNSEVPPPLSNGDRAVIEIDKIWSYALDPFNINKKIALQKERGQMTDKKEASLRKQWQARVGLYASAGFSLRSSPTSTLDVEVRLRESAEEIVRQIAAAAKSSPATQKKPDQEIICADVLMDLKGPTQTLKVKTGWRYQNLTQGQQSDIPRLIAVIPVAIYNHTEKENS